MSENTWLSYGNLQDRDSCGIGAVVDIRGRQSREIVDDALKIIEKLEHRAGKDATGEIGDGVGILTQICHPFFRKAAEKENIVLPEKGDYGIGMFFFPQEVLPRRQAQKMFEIISEKEGLPFLGWRVVPSHPEILGQVARKCMPFIMQCFVQRPTDTHADLHLKRNSMLSDVSLSNLTVIPM